MSSIHFSLSWPGTMSSVLSLKKQFEWENKETHFKNANMDLSSFWNFRSILRGCCESKTGHDDKANDNSHMQTAKFPDSMVFTGSAEFWDNKLKIMIRVSAPRDWDCNQIRNPWAKTRCRKSVTTQLWLTERILIASSLFSPILEACRQQRRENAWDRWTHPL